MILLNGTIFHKEKKSHFFAKEFVAKNEKLSYVLENRIFLSFCDIKYDFFFNILKMHVLMFL